MLIRDARAILVEPGVETSGDLEVPGGGTLDASGCVVTPGLVNAHHHLLQSAFRTLPGTRGVPMSHWLPTMAAAYGEAGVDPELAGLAASVGVAEGLLNTT
jgi:8-oxoguanine deaminase